MNRTNVCKNCEWILLEFRNSPFFLKLVGGLFRDVSKIILKDVSRNVVRNVVPANYLFPYQENLARLFLLDFFLI